MATIDDMFTGKLVTGVPALADQMAGKMPGDSDGQNQGDFCGS